MKKILIAGSLILLLAVGSVYAIDSGSGFGSMPYGQTGYGHMQYGQMGLSTDYGSVNQGQTYNCPMYGWTARSYQGNPQSHGMYQN